jgi:hypothetical protein
MFEKWGLQFYRTVKNVIFLKAKISTKKIFQDALKFLLGI